MYLSIYLSARLTHAEWISFLGPIANARLFCFLIVALNSAQSFALANCLIDSGQTGSVNVQCLHIRLPFRRQLGKKQKKLCETYRIDGEHMAHT